MSPDLVSPVLVTSLSLDQIRKYTRVRKGKSKQTKASLPMVLLKEIQQAMA